MADVAEGTVVDRRYRVRRRIGSGGMADVYLADDSQLGREVALKVLHRRFARDREFVERFRREASAAAGLQHPNVVSVFDRGEYDGTYYIAMEYLPGRTLKDLIREEAPLDQLRVISLAIQILQAAAFAHRRGVIHRDFKPHNVIVGPDDKLKVTDFGIARAGASEMTETGSIMGTAQYLSPEQAQGQRVEAPSDLYSIGIVIYEMLAARVPFGGESAVSIALKHVSETPPRLREFRPDVHPRLEQAVGRALVKDPAQRYASADEFIAALEQARGEMSSGGNGAPGGTSSWRPSDDDEDDPRGSRWPWIALAALLLGLVIAAVVWQPWDGGPPQRTVPSVEGSSAKRAEKLLEKAGFKVKKRGVESEEAVGRVLDQNPDGGAKADKGSTVEIVVSSGPARTLVPSVVSLPARQAQRELNDNGFKVTQDVVPSETIDEGLAIRTSPKEGTFAPKGSNVRLFISSGPPQVAVPSVIGQDKEDARATLEDAGLGVSVEEVESEAEKDEVIGQDPEGGLEVDKGTTVTLTVSEGPQRVKVPDVIGQDVDSAQGTLQDAGFDVRVKEAPSDEEEGTVIGQSPGGGQRALEGSTVTLTVAVPREEEVPPPDEGDPDDGGEGDQFSTEGDG
jgi:serine/threonine-protein kinase